MHRRLVAAAFVASFAVCVAGPAAAQQQMADPDFRPSVARPAYAANGPVVVIDAAHNNFHTADGRYKPFADLLAADGYQVRTGTAKFSAESLKGVAVLVVANAGFGPDRAAPVFTDAERAALRAWVEGGGALLLLADHAPFGAAAQALGETFGVGMGQGWAYDAGQKPGTVTSQLDYARAAGTLGEHPITRGRDPGEAVGRVRAFTGQSLTPPAGATNLMKTSPTAREAPDTEALNAAAAAAKAGHAFADAPARPSQGLAMEVGHGRVVVLGEAGMFSAQVVRFPPESGQADIRFGMNVAGTDNQQFALNVMRWLSGALR